MTRESQEKLSLFAQNARDAKRGLRGRSPMLRRLAALLYAQEGKPVDCMAIKQCYAMMKANTGFFSTFRGNMSLCIAAMLSLQSDPTRVFEATLAVYTMLKQDKFRASDYLVVAAYQIAAGTEPGNYANAVGRTKEVYDGMKAYHRFYTGQDDYIFAAMHGLADQETREVADRIERMFQRLKGEFWDRNSVQSLAQVMVLGGSEDQTIERVLALRDALKKRKLRLDRAYVMPTLGILALLPVAVEEIVDSINETLLLLRREKGFGMFSVNKQELLMLSAALVAWDYADAVKGGMLSATLSTAITNIIIAQQAAMIAAMAASSAAATAAANS